ncbi:LLM class flavin-dependent oxidoreductase [Solwaraspora sp. WMMA2101]|uniref:LLM class flavin-dependent oxidoreductase n=1 Tax=Solwaraspora sp. WMMA2101 TaxID=3404124 RepID=UPI003B93EBE7
MSRPDGPAELVGDGVRFGLLVPNVGYYADPVRLVRLARTAEESGWDGVFLWDHLLIDRAGRLPVADSWTAVTAILAGTRRIRCGPLVVPLAQRQPWKVARETATADQLSGGRLVVGVGLGASADTDFAAFGLDPSLAARARRVDESLMMLDQLWSGREISHRGDHLRLDRVTFLPTPVQRPRIPLWIAATWPVAGRRGPAARAARWGPLARAARWDGIVPMVREPDGGLRGPDKTELAEILTATPSRAPGWTVAVPGRLPPDDPLQARELVAGLRTAGATWWLESFDPWRRDPRQAWSWAGQGPPR